MTIGIPDALQVIRPNAQWVLDGNDYDGLEWLDQVQQKPSENEVQDTITMLVLEAPLKACKAKAKELIAATDWSVLPDVGLTNVADFEAYRATLRGLIVNPVQDPVWPVEPQPVWSK